MKSSVILLENEGSFKLIKTKETNTIVHLLSLSQIKGFDPGP